ncbi:MAG: aspartate dehydrogenase [Pseudomonadota bacterium]
MSEDGEQREALRRKLTVALMGYGGIARYVANALHDDPAIAVRQVVCKPGRIDDARRQLGSALDYIDAVGDLAADIDIVVECAGQAALTERGPAILERGINLMAVSTGALADPAFQDRLVAVAERTGTEIMIASGAIGALDAIGAASAGTVHEVRYIGRKPPAGWRGSAAEDVVDLDALTAPAEHFSGSAREAARRYPKNANVAASIALAGLGFDATQVTLIADPGCQTNCHIVEVRGDFGSFSFEVSGVALPDNPRSSALTAMSVLSHLRRMTSPLKF